MVSKNMIEKMYLKQIGIEALQAYLKNDDIQGILAVVHDNRDLFWIFKAFSIILKEVDLNIHDENLYDLIKEILNKNDDMI